MARCSIQSGGRDSTWRGSRDRCGTHITRSDCTSRMQTHPARAYGHPAVWPSIECERIPQWDPGGILGWSDEPDQFNHA